MKGLKFLASCAAIGALTTICAVSSYAATATYVDGGTVNVTGCEDYITAVGNNDLTLLVLDGTDVVTVGEANILQINQGDSSILTGIKLDTTKLTAGKTYEVRIGGAAAGVVTEKGFLTTTFTMPGGGDATIEKLIGDVNSDNDVTTTDVNRTLGIIATTFEDYTDLEWYAAAECVADSDVTVSDANAILAAIAGDYDNAANAYCTGHFKDLGDGEYELVSVDSDE